MSLTAEGFTVRGLSRVQWDALVEQGHFEGQRIELIEGEIVEMSPVGSPHWFAVRRLTRLLVPQMVDPWIVGVQGPFPAGPNSEPEPDISVLLDTVGEHPSVAALLIEVCDSSRRMDLTVKPRIYGAAGVPVYAVLDLRDRVLHVHQRPTDEGYLEKRVLTPGQSLFLTDPDITLDFADALPPAPAL